METRHRLFQSPRARLNSPALVLSAGSEAGGAERSLLEILPPGSATFLLPRPGNLAPFLSQYGHAWEILACPSGMQALTQRGRFRQGLRLLDLALQLPADSIRVFRRVRQATDITSLGVKSHVRFLLLAPLLRQRLLFDIRDFIQPRPLRSAIRFASIFFGCRIRANSRAVGRDYPTAEIVHPRVQLPRPVTRQQKPGPPWIFLHAAFFAPYKGQLQFLEIAAALLAQGIEAQFWLLGDAIYPAREYVEYAEKVRARAAREDLRGRIRFLGQVSDIQPWLEQAHVLLHNTLEPEPFGRVLLEAHQCGCEVICHQGSGACEVLPVTREFPGWMAPLQKLLGGEFVRLGATNA